MKSVVKRNGAFILAALVGAVVTHGEMLVYEPFDYQSHNHEVMGKLEGRNGGIGFGAPWNDVASEKGDTFVFDGRGNPDDLYAGRWGEGLPDWDGVIDNLPSMGGYIGISDWARNGSIHATRKLAQSAGAMAKANGGVLWLSAVWHFPDQGYFAPVGIALASNGSGFKERAIEIYDNGDAIGVGHGRNMRSREGKVKPVIWKAGQEVAGAPGPNVDGKKDAVVVLKFEFGEIDKVSAWRYSEDEEMTEASFHSNAVFCSETVDENTLQYLIIGTGRRPNAVDEIRIGTRFESVISGGIPARQDVQIVKTTYDAETDRYTLQIASNPGEIYGIYLAEDRGDYKPCVAAVVEASEDRGTTTFGPFANPRKGNPDLQFEVGLPDAVPPAIERVWGSGRSINLRFSERMLPETSLSPSSYNVSDPGGEMAAVKSVSFDVESGSIVLELSEALKPAQTYHIKAAGLCDLANNPLKEGAVELKIWDDDKKGVKVFILAGQSNMVGYGHTEEGQHGKGGLGTLRYLAVHDDKFPEFSYRSLLADPTDPSASEWVTRSNVKLWWRNGASAKLGGPIFKGDLGPLTSNGKWFGPEYGFGQAIGDHYKNEDVLIIKPAWGGHNLVMNFRSPYAVAKRGGEVGASYIELFDNVHEVLDNLGSVFPEWEGRGYEIVGFGWHQGTSDKAPEIVADEYKYNLPDFIQSVRAEFGNPDLPFVIATTGMSNVGPVEPYPYEGYHPVEKAQLWVAGVDRPSIVLTDDTRVYYEEAEVSPRNQGYHWNGNARSYFRVGYGLGTKMVTLLEQGE